jgi:hypothetical protein
MAAEQREEPAVTRWQFVASPRTLLAFVLFLGIFVMAMRLPLDSDMWWHLRLGQAMIDSRSTAQVDLYSHTAYGQSLNDHGWLGEVVLAAVYGLTGFRGLPLLVALAVMVTAWLIYKSSHAPMYIRAIVTLLAIIGTSGIWSPRPQMFSLPLFAAFVWILFSHREGSAPRRIWLLPLLTLLWVNLHATYAVGFAVMVIFVLADLAVLPFVTRDGRPPILRRVRQIGLVLGACLLVIPLSPGGLKAYLYPFQTVGIGTLQAYIEEWASPNFHQLFQQPFIWQLALLVAAIGLSGATVDWADLGVIAAFAYAGLLARRNLPFFALATAPILMRYAAESWGRLRSRWFSAHGVATARKSRNLSPPLAATINGIVMFVLVVAGTAKVANVLSPSVWAIQEAALLPKGAVEFLKSAEPHPELFNSYNWGGYLTWTLYPTYRVFVDGRTDLFNGEVLDDYLTVYGAREGWQNVFDRWNIHAVLAERDSTVAGLLKMSNDWRLVYEDDLASVFFRDQ